MFKFSWRHLGIVGLSLLLYFVIIGQLRTDLVQQQKQLQEKQQQLQQMQLLAKNIKVVQPKTNNNHSLLADISRLRNQFNLKSGFSKISVDKDQASVQLKRANYQAIIRFLIQADQVQIYITQLQFNQAGDGLVNGQIKLKR